MRWRWAGCVLAGHNRSMLGWRLVAVAIEREHRSNGWPVPAWSGDCAAQEAHTGLLFPLGSTCWLSATRRALSLHHISSTPHSLCPRPSPISPTSSAVPYAAGVRPLAHQDAVRQGHGPPVPDGRHAGGCTAGGGGCDEGRQSWLAKEGRGSGHSNLPRRLCRWANSARVRVEGDGIGRLPGDAPNPRPADALLQHRG